VQGDISLCARELAEGTDRGCEGGGGMNRSGCACMVGGLLHLHLTVRCGAPW
jgi:hypothetical protein